MFQKNIFLLFFVSLLSSSFFLVGPYLSKLFIDNSFLAKDINNYLKLTIIGIVLFIFSIIVNIFESIIRHRITTQAKLTLSKRFIKKFYSLDFIFLQNKSVGENIFRLSDTDRVVKLIFENILCLLVDCFKMVLILGILLWINPYITLIVIAFIPLFLLESFYIRNRLRVIYLNIWKANAYLSQKIYEAFSKILIIKVLNFELFQKRLYIKYLVNNIRLNLKSFQWDIISSVSSTFLVKAGLGMISLYGGWLIIKGRLSLGSYSAIMLYLSHLGVVLQALSNNFVYSAQEIIPLDKFFEIMEAEPKIKDLPGAVTVTSLKGEIHFNTVSFGYKQDKPILKSLTFKIPAGKWVGIIGPSGIGKTTLINLILRLYDPWDGAIFLDELDLRNIALRSLRSRVSLASQEPLLFDVSIRENITYGLKKVRDEEIVETLRIVQAYESVKHLPRGEDTLVKELSQGYKQKIALARAIIRNPDLLILDEATSSIDSASEERILSILREKRAGRSTIIISHRMFSIHNSDKVYFLTSGSRIEEGTHSELLENSPSYSEFFQNQIQIAA